MGLNDEDWEKSLLQPPVTRHLSDEMRSNIHRRVVEVEKKSTNTRFNRVMVGFASVAAVCIAAVGVYFLTGHTFTRLVGTASQQAASRGWSTANVEQYIVEHEKAHSVTNINVIYTSSLDGFKVAFASFDLDGQFKYGSIFDSPTQGTSLGTFTASQDKKNPLQYTETVGQNGFNLVTGVVVGNPRISNVVLTFKNGTIKTVPVVNGKFWYAGKIGTTDTVSFTQTVLGVTDTGQIVDNIIPSANNSTTTSMSQSQLASMSPQQLAQSAQKDGRPLPFASKDITRRVLTQHLTANTPNSGSAFPHSFGNANFYVVDQWSGTIQGKVFKLEVQMKPDATQYIIGMMSGTTTAAVRLDTQPWITNFTGSYVVFASPSPAQGNQMLAMNLVNGEIIKDSNLVRQMSGITGQVGYPTRIGGLDKSYDVFPNGGNSY